MEKNQKGRSLKDLLAENIIEDTLEGEIIEEIDLKLIKPNPYQPRRVFNEDKINELANSIKINGVFQPIILKKTHEGYLIVAGERRYRASLIAGLQTIPSIVRPYETNKLAEIALLENLQREDLTPIEEAEAYRSMMERFSLTHLELAKQVGKSRSHITNMLGLLKLPPEVTKLILEQKLSMGHARVLSKIKDSEKVIKLANIIIEKDYSVRQVEQFYQKDRIDNEYDEKSLLIDEKILQDIENEYEIKVKVSKKGVEFQIKDQETLDIIIKKLI